MALGQTFINNFGDGAFLTSIDLFFKSKDSNIPVTVAIIETLGGKPADRILPFSIVTKILVTLLFQMMVQKQLNLLLIVLYS